MIQKNSALLFMEETARQAGDLVMRLAAGAVDVSDKGGGNNPVTTIDKAVDAFLKHELCKAYPDHGWLSEETADNPARLKKKALWIVDPIDGTKGLVRWLKNGKPTGAGVVAGTMGFAISVARVVNGVPTEGVIYAPHVGFMVSAQSTNIGAWVNGDYLNPPRAFERCMIQTPSERDATWEAKLATELNLTGVQVGSIALRMALVGVGLGALVANRREPNEWDIAAGVLICQQMQVPVTNMHGQTMTFNKPKPVFAGMVAAAPFLHAPVVKKLQGQAALAY